MKWTMTLGSKIKAIICLCITIFLAFGIFSYFEMEKLGNLTQKMYRHPFTVSTSVGDLKYGVLAIQHRMSNASSEISAQAVTDLKKELMVLDEKVLMAISKVEERFLGDKNKVLMTKDSYLKWNSKNLKVLDLYEKRASPEVIKGQQIECRNLLVELKGHLEYLLKFAATKGESFYKKTTEYREASRQKTIASFLLGFFIIALVAYFIIKNVNNNLTKLSSQLDFNSKSVSDESKEINESSLKLSETSTQQASSIQETASSLEEFSAMVKNNVGEAEKSKQLSDSLKSTSNAITKKMDELVVSMEEIIASNQEIEGLVKVIEEIGDKTKIIDDIVFQTKILSFNASVEAERAGEHGRGFSVVAQEVSNLAQISGKASGEITRIVKDSVEEAKGLVLNNSQKVQLGNQLVGTAREVMEEVRVGLETINKNAGQILIASQDQAQGIEQINIAISEIDQATQKNAVLAETVASAGRELDKQADHMNASVCKLKKMVTGKGASCNSETKEYSEESHEEKTERENILEFKEYEGPKSHTSPEVSEKQASDSSAWEKI